MKRFLWLAPVVLLSSSCQEGQQMETAQHALRVFCALHKADIFATLLTQDQRTAGTIVCLAVGMSLGT